MSAERQKRKSFKALLAGPEPVLLHAIYDGFTARMVERFGYPAAFLSGAALSESRIGYPDVGLMRADETLGRLPPAIDLHRSRIARRRRHRLWQCRHRLSPDARI
ncbi:MAG: hypothetical protein WDN48_15960 [Pseudolabrys sp.]